MSEDPLNYSLFAKDWQQNSYCNSSRLSGEAGAGGILLDPRGNMILTYQWGLGRATNNIAERYDLYLGLDFTVSMGI